MPIFLIIAIVIGLIAGFGFYSLGLKQQASLQKDTLRINNRLIALERLIYDIPKGFLDAELEDYIHSQTRLFLTELKKGSVNKQKAINRAEDFENYVSDLETHRTKPQSITGTNQANNIRESLKGLHEFILTQHQCAEINSKTAREYLKQVKFLMDKTAVELYTHQAQMGERQRNMNAAMHLYEKAAQIMEKHPQHYGERLVQMHEKVANIKLKYQAFLDNRASSKSSGPSKLEERMSKLKLGADDSLKNQYD